ncbi:MAG TPA: HAD-IIB family hydrolase [Nitrososphaera sp.]|nr:HAD-IIB family hydrolase [Nitrososphaera sp.]
MNNNFRKNVVVFTDIDGTLIDAFTRDYGRSIELVKKLTESSIPVVLCSSKTRSEQDAIRRDLGLEGEPFIVENGGAIVIPDGYFDANDLDRYDVKRVDGYLVIELGKPSSLIRNALHEIRKTTGISFKGVSDVSIDELAKIVGMTYKEAERMSKRDYGETILLIDKEQKALFEQVLRERPGLQVIHGGRYFDVTAGNDKGKAVWILADLYHKKLGSRPIFIGIGDSSNDIPMLKSTDIAMLVQKYDGTWADVDIPNVIKIEGIGPAGWERAFPKIMQQAERTYDGIG